MSVSTLSSSAGSCPVILASAASIALTQVLVEDSTHVSITLEKPTSLPPTVMDTSVVCALSADSWPLITEAVVAPEHATNA
jgi:hypothetical protein